ncbi:MAG TPA: hypothetical protein VFS08_02785 [Gemmatimonadaceae bacterium]|nr:hypothetical protein [Gemmatimonadaceae bacterium]
MSIESSREFYVGWGTLAMINGNLAQLKGRSGLAWFIGSLFVGPIATFLLCFVRPVIPGHPAR